MVPWRQDRMVVRTREVRVNVGSRQKVSIWFELVPVFSHP